MTFLSLFSFFSIVGLAYSQCMPSLHFFNPRTGVDFRSFVAPTTVSLPSITSSFDIRAEFCSDDIRSVVFTVSQINRRRILNRMPYTSGHIGRSAISRIRARATSSGEPQFIRAIAFDGFKATGSIVESFQLTLVATAKTRPSPLPSPSPSPSPIPSIPPPPPLSVALVSPSESTFNAPGPLIFEVMDVTFDQNVDNVVLQVNNVSVPSSAITLTPTRLTADANLISGRNEFFLEIASPDTELLLTLNTAVWIGFQSLTVNLLNADGSPFVTQTTVTATLADDLSVQAAINTDTGSATFENLPLRTILVEAVSEANEIGSNAILSADGPLSIIIAGFNEPSTIDNNDFSVDLAGWDIPVPGTVTIVEHVEDVGPDFFNGSPEPSLDESPEPFFEASSARLPEVSRQLTNMDLVLDTQGQEGSQQVFRTFQASFGTTAVRVRYRFITSEIPGGFFGSMFNDFFTVSIRSQNAGDSILESASMNGLGFDAFNPATGSTAWREETLQLDYDSDTVEVRITVANVGDDLFDSQVIVDFVEELGCNRGEPLGMVIAVGPFDALEARGLADDATQISRGTGLPGAHNGQQDAFRHCFWSCRMAQEIGADQAREVGDLHELCGNNPEAETAMDLNNNAVGRSFGTAGANCRNLCLQGVSNGALQITL